MAVGKELKSAGVSGKVARRLVSFATLFLADEEGRKIKKLGRGRIEANCAGLENRCPF